MATMIGIYKISISDEADHDAFKKCMELEIFPLVGVGIQTRGGIVKSQSLLKNISADDNHHYSWVVRWQNQGGSPFGVNNAPDDPAAILSAFGATTSFERYMVESEDFS